MKLRGEKKCSYCSELIESDARVCKYCGMLLYDRLDEDSQQPLESGLPDASLQGQNLLKQLRSQSTWRLLLLHIITFGIYTSYYIKRQTVIINQHVDENSKIPIESVNIIVFLAVILVAMMVVDVAFRPGHTFELLINFLSILWSVLVLIWAFKARNRMNKLMSATKNEFYWFNGFWTFMFNALYFNYKINSINDRMFLK